MPTLSIRFVDEELLLLPQPGERRGRAHGRDRRRHDVASSRCATNWSWLLIPLTYGFVARVAAGPKISPLGQFAVRVAAPRLTKWQKSVPGPPKRFAQSMGLAFSGAATIVWLTAGWGDARWILDSAHRRRVARGIPRLLPRVHGLWVVDAQRRHPREDLRRVRGPLEALRRRNKHVGSKNHLTSWTTLHPATSRVSRLS